MQARLNSVTGIKQTLDYLNNTIAPIATSPSWNKQFKLGDVDNWGLQMAQYINTQSQSQSFEKGQGNLVQFNYSQPLLDQQTGQVYKIDQQGKRTLVSDINSPDELQAQDPYLHVTQSDWGTASIGKPYNDPTVRSTLSLSKEYGVDPNLMAATFDWESGFDQKQVSPTGAIGVAQAFDGARKDVEKELGVKLDLNDKTDNMTIGIVYMRQQLERFAGNVAVALAAYKAGPTAISNLGGKIPLDGVTDKYVKGIMAKFGQKPDPSLFVKTGA
jgi:soluble lytic murein transglycosylase-like protein